MELIRLALQALFYFNSIKVRLEFWQYKSPYQCQRHFNSIKVRLESVIIVPYSLNKYLFQFHKGAIGVSLAKRVFNGELYFNSIKVRLEFFT